MQITERHIYDTTLQDDRKYWEEINKIFKNIAEWKEYQFNSYLVANGFKDLDEFKQLFGDDPHAREIVVYEYLLTRKWYTY